MRRTITLLLLSAALPVAAGDRSFSLGLDRIHWPPLDPRTAERLAEWDSPLGRTAQALAQEQARLGSGPQPRPSSQAVVRVKVRPGLPLSLVTAVQTGGVELAETSVAPIHWPWDDEKPSEPSLPLDEQLSLLLGQRLKP